MNGQPEACEKCGRTSFIVKLSQSCPFCSPAAPLPAAPAPIKCQRKLREQGKLSPRTCMECKLGPCRFDGLPPSAGIDCAKLCLGSCKCSCEFMGIGCIYEPAAPAPTEQSICEAAGDGMHVMTGESCLFCEFNTAAPTELAGELPPLPDHPIAPMWTLAETRVIEDYARAAYAMGRGAAVRDYVCLNDAALGACRAPAEVAKDDHQPIAWTRKWFADGEKPAKEKKENGRLAWPFRFKLLPLTPHKICKDDVPLFAARQAPAVAAKEELVPKWAGQFDSHAQWVNKAQSWLASPDYRRAICVDAKGRRCAIGADMARARDEGAFPVRFFWECEIAAARQVGAPDGAVARDAARYRWLRAGTEGIEFRDGAGFWNSDGVRAEDLDALIDSAIAQEKAS